MTGAASPSIDQCRRQDDRDQSAGEAIESYIASGCTPREKHRLGIELEAILYDRSSRRAPYAGGHGSVSAVIRDLMAEVDGDPVLERGRLVGYWSREGDVSLEPGGQLEWSSPPVAGAPCLVDSAQRWSRRRDEAVQKHGLRIEPRGVSQLPVEHSAQPPKQRYAAMRRRYTRLGSRAFDPMHKTAGIHLSFDFASADDWADRFRAMLWLAPLAVAVFANSPGRYKGLTMRALRPWLWHAFDPHRTQLPGDAHRPGFSLQRYSQWAASRRPLLGRAVTAVDASQPAEQLGGLFPPVRSKQLLEVRVNDRVTKATLPEVISFWDAAVSDDSTRQAVLEVCQHLTTREQWVAMLWQSCRAGNRVGGETRRLASRLPQLVQISGAHLEPRPATALAE